MNYIASFNQRINKRKKILILHAILITTVLSYFVPGSEIQSFRRTASVISDDRRPIMHTFYEKLPEGEDDLLVAWKEEWTLVGFETRVLNFEDAKRHPYFKQMEEVVKPMFGEGYNAMCLYRWLAIAASGGGWMTDYDTFPTNFPMDEGIILPNNGNLTSFEVHVPSLMSGRADEWTRVAKLLVEAFPKVERPVKSDMHALEIIRNEAVHNIHFLPARLNMIQGFPYKNVLSSDSLREVDCDTMAGGVAIHFAHYYTTDSYDKGMFPLPNVTSSRQAVHCRGKAARVFMADWRDQCGGSNIE